MPILAAPIGAATNKYISIITLDKPIGSKDKGESSKAKEKEERKAKVEDMDTMGVKRAKKDKPYQGKKKGESSRKPTRP